MTLADKQIGAEQCQLRIGDDWRLLERVEEPINFGPIALAGGPLHLARDAKLEQRVPDLWQRGQPIWRERAGDGFELRKRGVRLAGCRQRPGHADPCRQRLIVPAEHTLVGCQLLVELSQHFIALSEQEVDLPCQLRRFSDERADGIQLLLGREPTLLSHQQTRMKQADRGLLVAVRLDKRADRLLRFIEPVGLQEDVAQHSKERRVARLRGQALAEHGDRPIPVLTLHSDGGEASIDSFVAGEQRAGLGRQLFSDVVPLLGDGQFKVGEQHVGGVGGEFGSRFDCR